MLIYQHMVQIDNPSALRAVGNQRERGIERQSVREKKRMMVRKRKDEFAGSYVFFSFFPFAVNSRPWSSYKAQLSSTSSKNIRPSFIFNGVFCSKQVVIVLHICVWYANS